MLSPIPQPEISTSIDTDWDLQDIYDLLGYKISFTFMHESDVENFSKLAGISIPLAAWYHCC